jgi:hypothetical protein
VSKRKRHYIRTYSADLQYYVSSYTFYIHFSPFLSRLSPVPFLVLRNFICYYVFTCISFFSSSVLIFLCLFIINFYFFLASIFFVYFFISSPPSSILSVSIDSCLIFFPAFLLYFLPGSFIAFLSRKMKSHVL